MVVVADDARCVSLNAEAYIEKTKTTNPVIVILEDCPDPKDMTPSEMLAALDNSGARLPTPETDGEPTNGILILTKEQLECLRDRFDEVTSPGTTVEIVLLHLDRC